MLYFISKRIVAFLIDYAIILSYGLILFVLFSIIPPELNFTVDIDQPWEGQLLGFVIFTLPVFLYFYLSENSEKHQTLGKKAMKIRLVHEHRHKKSNYLLRNFIKFLPWEIAHSGVHWIVYHTNYNFPTPVWNWLLLLTPMLAVFIYLISVFTSGGDSSVYDRISNTKLMLLIEPGK